MLFEAGTVTAEDDVPPKAQDPPGKTLLRRSLRRPRAGTEHSARRQFVFAVGQIIIVFLSQAR
ncbi:MAG: hypothetical protein DME24_15405 [Verrucomicrobia bacterium]|nr:MAG: hypothetical protein DME24_15405 [Verrucomicrobiota bacterium]